MNEMTQRRSVAVSLRRMSDDSTANVLTRLWTAAEQQLAMQKTAEALKVSQQQRQIQGRKRVRYSYD